MFTDRFVLPRRKRFRLIFTMWGHKSDISVFDFDTLSEAKEDAKEIRGLYHDTPRPEVNNKRGFYDYSNGGSLWGYIILDYDNNSIVEIYNDGVRITGKYSSSGSYAGYEVMSKSSDKRRIRDFFFRTEEDVPDDYNWDVNEYSGWLQFKWGDGKNAVNYKPKSGNVKDDIDEVAVEEDEYDYLQDDYDRQFEKEEIDRKNYY